MRTTTMIAGVALIAIGAMLFYRGGSFTTRRDVLKAGDLRLTADESHPVAPWMAGAAIVGGILLVVAGRRKA